eukprot:m.33960 g.33960  ORF g.33960 m.33960 type:complete len:274 (-) comp14276_c0_seq1:2890-3711(-)
MMNRFHTHFVLVMITATAQGTLSMLMQEHAQEIQLQSSQAAHSFTGHGGLSAGASSRLLYDYAEPHRSNILDYLFQPQFGASMQILKIEIGGDVQSTDGTEASHMHNRQDLSCIRGYESWLAQEAKKRNPAIILYGLSWGVPGWVGDNVTSNVTHATYFSDDNLEYQVAWVRCMNDTFGLPIDYLGIWNEMSWGSVDYVVRLKQALEDNGFTQTKLVLPDGGLNMPDQHGNPVLLRRLDCTTRAISRTRSSARRGRALNTGRARITRSMMTRA